MKFYLERNKEMKVLFVTQSVFPLNGGRTLASYGYVLEYKKHCDLTLASPVSGDNKQKDEVSYFCNKQGINAILDLKTSKTNLGIISEIPTRIVAKLTMSVPVYKNLYYTICRFIIKNKVELVIIDHIGMALYFKKLKCKFPNLKFIYNSHNVEFQNTRDELLSKAGRSPIKKLYAQIRCHMRKNLEQYMITKSEYVFCISRNDIEKLALEFGFREKYIFSKPLIEFSKVKTLADIQEYHHKLMIVGSMNWYPNVKGVQWFVENVFRKLQKRDPQLKLYLVGSKPTKEIQALASDNIVVTGFVDSTEPYFKECDISVIPVFEGTGAKIKVLESIARGIPTVCAGFAAKDYDIQNEISVVNLAEEFEKAIIELSQDQEKRIRQYRAMEAYYIKYFQLNPEITNIFSKENGDRYES